MQVRRVIKKIINKLFPQRWCPLPMDHPARRLNDAEINALKDVLAGFEDNLILSDEVRHQITVGNISTVNNRK